MQLNSISATTFGQVKIAPDIRKTVAEKLKNTDYYFIKTLDDACNEFKNYEHVHLRIDENLQPIIEDGKHGSYGEFFRFLTSKRNSMEMNTVWKGPNTLEKTNGKEITLDFATILNLSSEQSAEMHQRIKQANTPLKRAIELVKTLEPIRAKEKQGSFGEFYFPEMKIAEIMSKVGK